MSPDDIVCGEVVEVDVGVVGCYERGYRGIGGVILWCDYRLWHSQHSKSGFGFSVFVTRTFPLSMSRRTDTSKCPPRFARLSRNASNVTSGGVS